jgi:hypothetical protein
MVIGNYSGGFAIFRTDMQTILVDTDSPYSPQAGIHIFPNPASKEVTVQLQHTTQAAQQFLLFDAAGRLVLSERQSGDSWRFSVEGLAKGLYFVKVIGEQGVLSSKLLVR